jgi:hypothetical protein
VSIYKTSIFYTINICYDNQQVLKSIITLRRHRYSNSRMFYLWTILCDDIQNHKNKQFLYDYFKKRFYQYAQIDTKYSMNESFVIVLIICNQLNFTYFISFFMFCRRDQFKIRWHVIKTHHNVFRRFRFSQISLMILNFVFRKDEVRFLNEKRKKNIKKMNEWKFKYFALHVKIKLTSFINFKLI